MTFLYSDIDLVVTGATTDEYGSAPLDRLAKEIRKRRIAAGALIVLLLPQFVCNADLLPWCRQQLESASSC